MKLPNQKNQKNPKKTKKQNKTKQTHCIYLMEYTVYQILCFFLII